MTHYDVAKNTRRIAKSHGSQASFLGNFQHLMGVG